MEKKRNNIKIKTISGGEENTWESDGYLVKKGDVYLMDYPDYAGNTQTDNQLQISPNGMTLHREGAFNSHMIFEENMLTVGEYNVMFYMAQVEVLTESYKLIETEDTIEIKIDYKLFESQNELASMAMDIMIEKSK